MNIIRFNDDDDFNLEYKKNNISIERLESVMSYIMKNVSHLWRLAKYSDITESAIMSKKIKENTCENYSQSLIRTSAYTKKDNEKTLSVFELDKKLRCAEGHDLSAEALVLMVNLGMQSYTFNNSSLPIALIREKLKNILLLEEKNIEIIGLIEKSPPKEQKNVAAYHWDIHLPSSDEDRQKLYQMLAMSSEAYQVKDLNPLKVTSKALKAKRKLECNNI